MSATAGQARAGGDADDAEHGHGEPDGPRLQAESAGEAERQAGVVAGGAGVPDGGREEDEIQRVEGADAALRVKMRRKEALRVQLNGRLRRRGAVCRELDIRRREGLAPCRPGRRLPSQQRDELSAHAGPQVGAAVARAVERRLEAEPDGGGGAEQEHGADHVGEGEEGRDWYFFLRMISLILRTLPGQRHG
ncbi:hypothetical protein TCAP_02635 [Tolypocladium capitatum]|uniref:Uncharacterized protein n=1 Tax=Tolypocladium capitatum TaxID=45235 RepID=A0A2K3QIS5_9HYPO|nr:hypothetical protein TCAP_02635 [Tolypocladium capitatum]